MNKNILKRKLLTLTQRTLPNKTIDNCFMRGESRRMNAVNYGYERGVKIYKNTDRATECAMTDVGEKKGKIKMNKNNLQQKQPSCPAAFSATNHSLLTTHHSPKRKFAFTLAEF